MSDSIKQVKMYSDLINNEFENIIGLNNVKEDLNKFQNHLTVMLERKKRNLKIENIPLHSVFLGPPGTGKTTVARIMGKVLKNLGILKSGHVVEVDRGDLVAGYIGQTALKTMEKLNEAVHGVLFIDEAYSLSKGTSGSLDFGSEAIDTVLKFMEDNRNKVSVIVAGYEDEMRQFINSNPGLESRFTRYYEFNDYTVEELTQIMNIYFKNEGYYTTDYILENYIKNFIDKYKKKESLSIFGNGRAIRNIFEEIKVIQSQRICLNGSLSGVSDDFLQRIQLKDIKILFEKYNFELPYNPKMQYRNTLTFHKVANFTS